MRHRVIFVTGNEGKMREIRALLGDLGLPVLFIKEASMDLDTMEDGTTFGENAKIKVRAVWKVTGDVVLANGSGLMVDYIGGEPGMYSVRYIGEDTFYEIENRSVIDRLKDVEGRSRNAQSVCNMAAALPDGRVLHTEEIMKGMTAKEPAGSGGSGYDPTLFLSEYSLTLTEIIMEEKNKINHRGKALRAMEATPEKMPKREMERTQDEGINCQ